MNKEVISDHQGIALVSLFIMGSSLVLVTGIEAGRDLWIAILMAMVFAVPLYAIYGRLLTLFPGKDLYQIMEVVFGRIIGKGICILYIWFAFHLGSLVLRNFGEYLNTVGIPETPKIVPIVFFALLCLWGAKEGIEVLGRWSTIFLNLFVVIVISTILLLSNLYDLGNILPILYNGFKPVFAGAWDVFAFPLAEVVVIACFFSHESGKNSSYKIFWGGLLIGGLIIFATTASELAVLGIDLYSGTYFPSHIAISLINVGDFLERLEIIPAIAFFIGGFVKISACILAVSKGVARVFNLKDYRFIVTPLALLMVNLSYFIYDDIVEMSQIAAINWKYYAFPFQVILPVSILIAAEVKVRWRGKSGGEKSV